jgi:hypothetical protein
VFHAVPEQPTDLTERIMFVATAAKGVLLHARPDLIDHLGAQPDYVEGVQHGDSVRQAVADRVGVATKRIQRGLLHAVDRSSGWVFSQAL